MRETNVEHEPRRVCTGGCVVTSFCRDTSTGTSAVSSLQSTWYRTSRDIHWKAAIHYSFLGYCKLQTTFETPGNCVKATIPAHHFRFTCVTPLTENEPTSDVLDAVVGGRSALEPQNHQGLGLRKRVKEQTIIRQVLKTRNIHKTTG